MTPEPQLVVCRYRETTTTVLGARGDSLEGRGGSSGRAKIEHRTDTDRFVREFAASPVIASAWRSVIPLRVDSVEISGAD